MSCQGCRRVQLLSQAEEFSIPHDGYLSPVSTIDSPRRFKPASVRTVNTPIKINGSAPLGVTPLDETSLLACGLINSSCKRVRKTDKIGQRTESLTQPPITLAEINSRGIQLENGEVIYALPKDMSTDEFEYHNTKLGPVKCKFEKDRSSYEIKGKKRTMYYSTSKNTKMLIISKD